MTEATPPKSKPKTEELPPISLEELMNLNSDVLHRKLKFESPDGTSTERRVTFRRLTYKEIHTLKGIPEDETERYTNMVIFMASVEPKFATAEDTSVVPHGFAMHYSRLILSESGKNPFLG